MNRLFLAQHSPFFRAAFYGQFAEDRQRFLRLLTVPYDRLFSVLVLLTQVTDPERALLPDKGLHWMHHSFALKVHLMCILALLNSVV